MRVFAALPFPRAAIEAIESALAPLRRLFPRLRWVAEKGLHVTIRFFGEVPEPGVAAIQRVFDDRALRREPISAQLGAFGQFPARGNPRVLWVGLARGGEDMRKYCELFASAIAPLEADGGPLEGSKPDERGFTAHVTVARNNGVAMKRGWEGGIEVPPVDFLIEECVLFQSILGRGGAEYIPLRRIPFERMNR